MADDDVDQDQRTEQASSRKLQQSWDQGDVPLGHDAPGVLALAAGGLTLMLLAPTLGDSLLSVVRGSIANAARGELSTALAGTGRPFLLTLAAVAASAVAAALVTVAQTQGGLWPEKVLPDLSRVFSGGRLSRLLGKEFWVDLGLAALKVGAVGAASYGTFRQEFFTLHRYLTSPAEANMSAMWRTIGSGGVKVMAVMMVLAVVDILVIRWRFHTKLKMTKEEAKREYKEDEGDPLIKSRRKRRHRELAKGRTAVEVPRADALLVNPTHVAVAIRYRRDEGKAPRVTAKGKGQLAEIMRDLARENGVPIVKDIPLARLLYRKVKVGKSVPAETYKAVAAVLAFVYRLTGKNQNAAA